MNYRSLMALLLLFAGCATSPPSTAPDNFVAANYVPPPFGELVVLVPAPRVSELLLGERHMTVELARQLKTAGYRVGLMDDANFQEVWSQEVADIGGVFDPTTGQRKAGAYEAALSNLAKRTCLEAKCALLIMQRLVRRPAELSGRNAEWDGARRPLLVTQSGGELYRSTGTTPALSVELVGIRSDGSVAFRRFGGASLLFSVNAFESKAEFRKDLFDSDSEVAEAVRTALAAVLKR